MNMIIDAHEDLAWNIATFNRDYSLSAYHTRELEIGSIAPQANGDTLLGYPEYQAGNVAIVFGTLFASPKTIKTPSWDTQSYLNTKQAHQLYRAQLDLYTKLEDTHPNKFRLLNTKKTLEFHLQEWELSKQNGIDVPVGLVILMEGAEGIEKPDDVFRWWDAGVRIIGLAWHGNQYCGGTGQPGPLTSGGKKLLNKMAEVGFILDISHMDDLAARQALDMYEGQVIASHANASTLIRSYQGNRHLSDELIQHLITRNGIMGIIPLNNFLNREWKEQGGRSSVSLQMVAEQIDHVCQLAGDARHVGIGSDFDGGFGVQSTPHEIDTIADLQKISPLLTALNYSEDDISAILGKNWQCMLELNLP